MKICFICRLINAILWNVQSGKNALIYTSAAGATSSGPCVTSYRQGKVHAAPLGHWCLSTSKPSHQTPCEKPRDGASVKRHVRLDTMHTNMWTLDVKATLNNKLLSNMYLLGCSEIQLFHKQIWRNPINELL